MENCVLFHFDFTKFYENCVLLKVSSDDEYQWKCSLAILDDLWAFKHSFNFQNSSDFAPLHELKRGFKPTKQFRFRALQKKKNRTKKENHIEPVFSLTGLVWFVKVVKFWNWFSSRFPEFLRGTELATQKPVPVPCFPRTGFSWFAPKHFRTKLNRTEPVTARKMTWRKPKIVCLDLISKDQVLS